MTSRGFTLVELLLATVVTLLLLAAGLTMVASARWSLDVDPASFDTGRRARDGASALSDAVVGAGGGAAAADGIWMLSTGLPVVWPLTALDGAPGDRFTALWVLRALPGAGGRLAEPQLGPAASLTLDRAGGCPLSTPVCGFRPGDVAAIFDARGRFDIFEIGAVSDALGRLTPAAPLTSAYDEGAWVLAARADRFGLVPRSDGTRALTRVTWAGASEPLVDGVVDLEIVPWGRPDAPTLGDADTGPGLTSAGLPPLAPDAADPDGHFPPGEHCMVSRSAGMPQTRLAEWTVEDDALTRLTVADAEDGPWCPSDGAATRFDADLLRLRRIDIRMRVEALSAEFRGPAGRLFTRGGTAAANAPWWVADRTVALSVVLPGR